VSSRLAASTASQVPYLSFEFVAPSHRLRGGAKIGLECNLLGSVIDLLTTELDPCICIFPWACEHALRLQFIEPGKPIQNAHIERFNARLREEFS
jgi:hypothetical protein